MRWHRRFANRIEIEEQTDEQLLEVAYLNFFNIII